MTQPWHKLYIRKTTFRPHTATRFFSFSLCLDFSGSDSVTSVTGVSWVTWQYKFFLVFVRQLQAAWRVMHCDCWYVCVRKVNIGDSNPGPLDIPRYTAGALTTELPGPGSSAANMYPMSRHLNKTTRRITNHPEPWEVRRFPDMTSTWWSHASHVTTDWQMPKKTHIMSCHPGHPCHTSYRVTPGKIRT